MSTQFFENLSRNYIKILEDSEYYDVTIEVGKDPNIKIFRAHMNILCHRSPYLRRALASNNKKNNNSGNLSHIKLPNILPEIFQIILKYIYGGILSLNEQNTSDIFKVLVAADELLLNELVDYLQTYLIDNKANWIEQHFELAHRISFQSNNLLRLQKFCTNFMAESPDKVFELLDFTSLPEKSLISLLQRDDLQMKEIEVWEHVLKWGLTKNPTLVSYPSTWTDDDFKTMENTLRCCLPLIRFYSLSSKDFLEKVHPYKKLLKPQLYEDLLKYYLDFKSEPSNDYLPPRRGKLDSKIVNIKIASLVSKWIDKINENCKCALSGLYLPYEFKLLLRGSSDGFSPSIFHSLCEYKFKTVTFIKIKGTDEILGGYNPIIWETTKNWGEAKDSFIFSLKNKKNIIEDEKISYVKEVDSALNYGKNYGPSFGKDLVIYGSSDTKDYDDNVCKLVYYEKKIRDTENKFSIEDYEVFQIINKND
ncbi:uncharacterized protein OCT59_018311 [Rhizophagus irregularis]|uniref:Kelch-like protein 17 n=2 Tax=Rhizophagus irregularis TaxID=588596 RepID=A0A015J8I3_RHIIW|nr:hypothetical protein RirG_154800 [Rhizophagus irregularis DAOM 197198w]UZO26063.1 hypothetical protein OCT59_018311 [Rhizophagus irregularis]